MELIGVVPVAVVVEVEGCVARDLAVGGECEAVYSAAYIRGLIAVYLHVLHLAAAADVGDGEVDVLVGFAIHVIAHLDGSVGIYGHSAHIEVVILADVEREAHEKEVGVERNLVGMCVVIVDLVLLADVEVPLHRGS